MLTGWDGAMLPPEGRGRLAFRSSTAAVPHVRHLIQRVAVQAGLGADSVDRLLVAVSEALANAVTHGSPADGAACCVEVDLAWQPRYMMVEVYDEGPGFDPTGVPPPDLEDPPEHGYGLHLMRSLVDLVEIECACGTRVRLVKREPD